MVLVSIIVPVYNCEKDLKNCIGSIRQQTYGDLQIILVDDGSSDRSGVICDEMAESDGRITVIHNRNRGVSATRNCGIRYAEGKYVMFVDSDDFLGPTAVAETVEAAEREQADLVLYGFCYHNVTRETRRDNYPGRDFAGTAQHFAEVLAADLMEQEFFNPPWNKLISLEVLKKHELRFDERFSILEDMAFSMQVLQYSDKVVLLNRILYDYNIKESGSLVFKYYDNYFEALVNWYQCAMACVAKYGMPKTLVEKVDSIYVKKSYLFILRTSRQRQLPKEKRREIMQQIASEERTQELFSSLKGEKVKKWIFSCIKKRCYFIVSLFACLKGVH